MNDHFEEDEIIGLSQERIKSLSDGVFAIVLTLLVLLIEIPETINTKELPQALWERLHIFAAYLISFILLGIYWWRHHTLSHYIKRADKILTWLNLFFLLWIAFIPFPTHLLMEYLNKPGEKIAVIIYGCVHFMCGLVLLGIWCRASNRHRLIYKDLSPANIKKIKKLLVVNSMVYCVPIGLAFVNTMAAVAMLGLIPLLTILPFAPEAGEVNLSRYTDM